MFGISPEQLEQLSRLGVVGLLVLIGAAFYLRRFKLTSDVKDAIAAVEAERERERLIAAERLAEAKQEIEDWKQLATTYGGSNDRLAGAVETMAAEFAKHGIKVVLQ